MARDGDPFFVMTPERLRMAADIANADKHLTQIAEEGGIDVSTLKRWKKHPNFIAKVAEFRKEMEDETRHLAVASWAKRVQILQELLDKCRTVVRERASCPLMEDVPGGSTGLMAEKLIPQPRGLPPLREYAVDTGLTKEMRAILEQAARELGQWVEKHEDATKPEDGPKTDLSRLSDDQLRAYEHLARAARGLGVPVGVAAALPGTDHAALGPATGPVANAPTP